MKKIYFIHLLLISFLLFPSGSSSQSLVQEQSQLDKTDYDTKLLLHYSLAELDDLSTHHPEDFKLIVYYHLLSYEITITDPDNDFLNEFNLKTFDITLYEMHRKSDIPVIIEFEKYGISLELFPYDELLYLTPLQIIYKNALEE